MYIYFNFSKLNSINENLEIEEYIEKVLDEADIETENPNTKY